MSNIAIISSSVRTGRKSHRAALHLQRTLQTTENTVDVLDLMEYGFPLFDERLKFMKEPSAKILDFAEHIRKADGVIIVSPEYNGSMPASLKNVIDLLNDEWKNRPISLVAVSGGGFAGSQLLTALLFPLWKAKAWVVASSMQVPKVQEVFGEDGSVLQDQEGWDRRTKVFLDDLGWAMEAKRRMQV